MILPALSFCLNNNRMYIKICAWCLRIRTVEDQWEGCDPYYLEHSSLNYTHGICPACLQLVINELDNEEVNQKGKINV